MGEIEVHDNIVSGESTPTETRDKTFFNPTKLSWARKIHIVVAGFTCTFNGNLGSSIPSGALIAISDHFAVTNRTYLVLLNSLYMAGYVLGPLLFGPLSEYIGRRPVLIGTFLGYILFMLTSSVAPTYAVLLILRLFCGICASAPTAVIGGLYADIFDNPSHRGTAMALYMTVTTTGPLFGPIISGFASQLSWQWPFWVAGIIAAPGLPLVLTLPETFAPVLHNKMMKRYEKEGVLVRVDTASRNHVLDPRKIFVRPMRLMLTEPVLLASALYMALAYSLMFLTFQAYPIIFQKHYGLSPAVAGLAYIPIIVGAVIAFFICSAYTWWHDKCSAEGREWTRVEAYRRLPLACLASPCIVISLFWVGWTAYPASIAPIVPIVGGLFFGIGFQLLFISIINYVTDIYRDLSASAHSAASMTRSVGAVLLPLAAGPMYSQLGVHWAPSVLGFIALAMGAIPFVFIRFGERLTEKSRSRERV